MGVSGMAVMMAIIAPMTQFVFVCQGGQPIQQIYSNYPIGIVRSTDTTDTTYSLVVAVSHYWHITGINDWHRYPGQVLRLTVVSTEMPPCRSR